MLVSIPRFSDSDDALTCDSPPSQHALAVDTCRVSQDLPTTTAKGMYRFCFGLFTYLCVIKSIALESPLLVV